MLTELLRFLKTNLGERLVIYTLVVISLTLFGTLPSLFLRFWAFFVFAGVSGLFLIIFGQLFLLPGVKNYLAYKKSKSIPLPDEVVRLKNQMGVNLKDLRIAEGLCNAYVIGGSVVLGTEFLKKLSSNDILAGIAHELAHKKGRHILLRVGIMVPFLLFVSYSWSKLTSPIFFTESFTLILLTIMVNIGTLAFILVVMIVPNWFLEFKADELAAKFAGKENIKSALRKLVNKEDHEKSSETHPSIAERVKRIDKLRFERTSE